MQKSVSFWRIIDVEAYIFLAQNLDFQAKKVSKFNPSENKL